MMNLSPSGAAASSGVLLAAFVSMTNTPASRTGYPMIITTDCIHQFPDFLCLRCHPELKCVPIKDDWPTKPQARFALEPKKSTEFFLPPEKEKPKNKTEHVQQDLRGMRWCPRRNRFVVDEYQTRTATSQEEEKNMKKWKITCYNAANEVITRGSTSTPADTGQVELFAKMGAAYHRCAADTVNKVVVTDDDGEIIRTWEKGQNAEFPKPDPAAAPAPKRLADTAKEDNKKKPAAAKPAKGKGKATAKKAAAKPAAKSAGKKDGPIKKVGVIDTIVSTMKSKNGASIEEIVAVLKKKFPDRDEKGMTSTARIQANKKCSHKEKDDVRGLLYFAS
jgi:hypothetical protein